MHKFLALTVLLATALASTANASAFKARKIAAGAYHACALLEDRSIKCWGGNSQGQLGLGDDEDRGDGSGELGNNLAVVDIDSGNSTMQIALGANHSCALFGKGLVKCWGANDSGQLGLSDTRARGDDASEMGARLPLVNVAPGHAVKSLAAGGEHSCALLDDGNIKCWGNNDAGQLGLGDQLTRGDSILEMGNFLPAVDLGPGEIAVQITAGLAHSCARLEGGRVKCWGNNGSGQLGLGTSFNRGDHAFEMGSNLSPVNLGAGRSAVHIDAGNDHTCALLDDDTVKCWGHNDDGQLGLGDEISRGHTATEMGDQLPAVQLGLAIDPASRIEAGGFHSCALLGAYLRCWGANSTGQLGLGDTESRGDELGEMGVPLPSVDVGTDRTVVQVAAGLYFTCTRLGNGGIKCWGANDAGQLGRGDHVIRGMNASDMGDALPYLNLGH